MKRFPPDKEPERAKCQIEGEKSLFFDLDAWVFQEIFPPNVICFADAPFLLFSTRDAVTHRRRMCVRYAEKKEGERLESRKFFFCVWPPEEKGILFIPSFGSGGIPRDFSDQIIHLPLRGRCRRSISKFGAFLGGFYMWSGIWTLWGRCGLSLMTRSQTRRLPKSS